MLWSRTNFKWNDKINFVCQSVKSVHSVNVPRTRFVLFPERLFLFGWASAVSFLPLSTLSIVGVKLWPESCVLMITDIRSVGQRGDFSKMHLQVDTEGTFEV
ncbi:hypothetical protein SDJN03_16427, partial [Cucurbita argyrosperma subsp. sororia]